MYYTLQIYIILTRVDNIYFKGFLNTRLCTEEHESEINMNVPTIFKRNVPFTCKKDKSTT